MRRLTGASCALSLVLALPAWASQSFIFTEREQFLQQTNASMATLPYLPLNGAPKSFSSGAVTFTAQGISSFFNSEWTDKLPGIDIALNDKEDLDMVLDAPVYAMGFGFENRDGGAGESTFTVTARLGDLFVDQFIFGASGNDAVNETFVGFWSPQLFDRLEIREVSSVNENEFFGRVYTGNRPPKFISKLKPVEGQPGDRFGQNLAVAGDFAAVAAPAFDVVGPDSGAVFLYQRGPQSNWQRIARLTPISQRVFEQFGSAVAMDSAILAVGTPSDGDLGVDSGSVTFWERQMNDQWIRQSLLLPIDGDRGQEFGHAVAIGDGQILIGAPGDNNFSTGGLDGAGAAYLFEKQPSGIWLETHKFVLDEPVEHARLGWDVAISGDVVALSASGIIHSNDGFAFNASGAVYLFERQGDGDWSQIETLTAETFREGVRFGQRVVMDGTRLAISETQFLDPNLDAGRVTLYARNSSEQWVVEGVIRGEDVDVDFGFGDDLALHDQHIVVGAPLTLGPTGGNGSVFLFNRTGGSQWALIRELPGPDSALSDNYGGSVAFDGASILIGAPNDDDLDNASGSAYLLETERVFDIYDILLRNGFEMTPPQP